MDTPPQESGPIIYISPQQSKKRFIYLLLSLIGILILIVGFALVFNRYGKFWERKTPAQLIGSPIANSYKLAQEYSLFSDYYKSMKDTDQLDEFGSPDVKFDEKGNVLIPSYPSGTLLQELNGINPANLPNRKENEGSMITIQAIVSGDLVKAREALKLNKTAEAKQALEKAEQDIAGKKFDGVEMVKPTTPEQTAKYGTMGRMLGVVKNLLKPYFRIVELIINLEKK